MYSREQVSNLRSCSFQGQILKRAFSEVECLGVGSWARDAKMVYIVNWTVITYWGGRESQEGRGICICICICLKRDRVYVYVYVYVYDMYTYHWFTLLCSSNYNIVKQLSSPPKLTPSDP